jgi:hypothetical protein
MPGHVRTMSSCISAYQGRIRTVSARISRYQPVSVLCHCCPQAFATSTHIKWDPKPADKKTKDTLIAYANTLGYHVYSRRNNRGFAQALCKEKFGMPEYSAEMPDPELVAGLKTMLLAVLEEYGVDNPAALDDCGEGKEGGCIFRGEGDGAVA